MERQEPQGEENGDPLANLAAHVNQVSSVSLPPNAGPSMPITSMELQMQLQQQRHMANAGHGGIRAPIPGSRPPMTSLDTHNMFPSLPRSLQEELISQQQAKLRGLVPSSSPMLSPMIGGMAQPPGPGNSSIVVSSGAVSNSDMLSKLTPSVYSHPTAVQDPVLNNKTFMDNVRGRGPLEMTSSGAFFDHKAVKKSSNHPGGNSATASGDFTSGSNNSSSDIIAKLTKEMLLSDAAAAAAAASNVGTPGSSGVTQPPQPLMAQLTLSSTNVVAGHHQQASPHHHNNPNSPQSIINKLNLSPAKTKTDLSIADKDLAVLKSSLAAKKAAAGNPARLSLVGANPLDKARVANDTIEALSRSQPDLFTGIEQRYFISWSYLKVLENWRLLK